MTLQTASDSRAACLSPELELLVCCARTELDAERAAAIRMLVERQIDWEYLVRAAQRHALAPLLYLHLKTTCPDAVPDHVLGCLRRRFERNAQRNLRMLHELRKTVELFESHGISAVPYKGPILAASLYGNLALREFGDLDILIHSRDVLRAKQLLISRGYRVEPRLTPAQEAAYLRFNREYHFRHPENDILVEVQWGLTAAYYSVSLDYGQFWTRLQSIPLAGRAFPSLGDEDLLLVLCIHGFQHVWERLEWVCGLAELIRRQPGLDWQLVRQRSRRIGCERILFLGLFLAQELLDAPLPDAVGREVQADASLRPLANEVYRQLFGEAHDTHSPGGDRLRLFHLQARERLVDRLRCCYHQLFTPYIPDWSVLPLPPALFPLYYLVRPARLIGKHARGLGRRVR